MKLQSALSVIVVALLAIAAVAAARTVFNPAVAAVADSPVPETNTAEFAAPTIDASLQVVATPETVPVALAPICQCEQAVEQLSQLLDEQQFVLDRLHETSKELERIYERVSADAEKLPPTPDWHERLITRNQVAYHAVVEIIQSITEEEFPTARTWYGENWRVLTIPFRVGRYPLAAERDQLLLLLEEAGDFGAKQLRLMQSLGALDYAE